MGIDHGGGGGSVSGRKVVRQSDLFRPGAGEQLPAIAVKMQRPRRRRKARKLQPERARYLAEPPFLHRSESAFCGEIGVDICCGRGRETTVAVCANVSLDSFPIVRPGAFGNR